MNIIVPPAAARSGVVRVWLRRIPEQGGVIYAFRSGEDGSHGGPIGKAYIYGRGVGSQASERAMLVFRPIQEKGASSFRSGESLSLKMLNPLDERYEDISLDVLSIE